MKFVVVPLTGPDTSVPPDQLSLPARTPLGPATVTRRLSLNSLFSSSFPEIQIGDLLGTLNADGTPVPLGWHDPITETVGLNATEIWELHNFTAVGHLIHPHLEQFELIDRIPFASAASGPAGTVDHSSHANHAHQGPLEPLRRAPLPAQPVPTPPEPWETGTKDVFNAPPGQITRIKGTFTRRGLYVWHCHILDHEDNSMMRPYRIQ
jgi:spore coat protein A, manganese oxidase